MIRKRAKRPKGIEELKRFYPMNEKNGRFIIEVSVASYSEIFNGWDPSPIKRRDLDPDLLDFILESSEDIPLKFGVELHFYLPESERDETKEELSILGIQNNIQFLTMYTRKEFLKNWKDALRYVVLSVIFLFVAYFFGKFNIDGALFKILIEGLFIGGWVFLWEAFSLIFFSDQKLLQHLKHYRRLFEAPILFHYQP
ncbi:MAG TPA: hypothetical protein VIK63_05510 [Haloplasmataceae bacterium]